MPLLRIEHVVKRYGAHAALRGFSLDVGAGEFVCLLGASGSGKTTLLRLIAGLEQVDSGSIRLGGQVVDAAGTVPLPAQQRGLGMVFQDYALWPHLSALENVALALRARRRAGARQEAQAMLERVGLGAQAARRPHELSGGQQQRVALARALAVRPRLLLCDEPLSNLDAGLREELRDLIASVVREHGLSALYITHDQDEAFALGHRVGVVEHGTLLQIAAPRELLRHPASAAVARFTNACGPWPVHVAAGRLSAPWGEQDWAGATASARQQLFLRPSALRVAAHPGQARARVLACLEYGDAIELHCELHGVKVRLAALAPLAPGSELALEVDLRAALLYPESESPAKEFVPT